MGTPSLAFGCGVCIEDKVAATYDHAIVTKAAAKKQLVVFGAVDGANINAGQVTKRIVATAGDIKGVQRGTTLASVEPPAFSFALDPRAQTPEAMAKIRRAIIDGANGYKRGDLIELPMAAILSSGRV